MTPLYIRRLEDWLPAFTSFLSSMMSILSPIVDLNHLTILIKVIAKASTVPGSILHPTKLILTIKSLSRSDSFILFYYSFSCSQIPLFTYSDIIH